ncbi:MAG: carboxyl-terminal protease [Akkermansiaceae bacterium]|nr:carboxyl-terminal protease [Akkermansiaceae bacterium]
MNMSRIRNAAAAAILSSTVLSACAQQANFDEVGKQMSILLQNSHFARSSFSKLAPRFLDLYLVNLDPTHSYFTQQDIDTFKHDYGDRMDAMLLQQESMKAANVIYDVFKKRVETRVAEAKQVLASETFDFTTEENILLSRKNASWPRDEAEASVIWRGQIKDALLSETLRQKRLDARNAGKEKPASTTKELSPKEKLAVRYERYLHSVTIDAGPEDVAALFLSAVAQSFDPHTDYLSAREMDKFRDSMRNELVGIGARMEPDDDGATKITAVVPGGPADKQGKLKLNDRVIAVDPDGEAGPQEMIDIMFMKIDKVVDFIRGQEGSDVTLKVQPADGAPGQTSLVTIKRDKVELKDEQASAEVIDIKRGEGDSVRLGVIILPSFYADFQTWQVRSSVDVEKLLQRLKQENINGLLFDIRLNGGGSLEEVRRMTGLFTKPGPVVQVRDAIGKIQVKESETKVPIYDGPMVVLTDKSSASASEILAGALQDDNRAVILGDSSTFGKGTVQETKDIGNMIPIFSPRKDAGTLKVTIQKFYRPSGSSTQNLGVVPDLKLPGRMEGLEIGETFLSYPLEHDLIRPAPEFRPLDREHLFIPQLKTLSESRIAASKDFTYISEEIAKSKERTRTNRVSLNLAEREKEIDQDEKVRRARNDERKTRFAGIEKQDKDTMTFYELTLDDLTKEAPLRKVDPAEKIRASTRYPQAGNDPFDETPKWPSALDPQKRESLQILGDLIRLSSSAAIATGPAKVEKE